ncbi:MAG: Uma2 family endonuclease [Ginsengibacter sp.]
MNIVLSDIIFHVPGYISDSMSEEEFFQFCQQNEIARIERDEKKQIIIQPPTYTFEGIFRGKISCALGLWNGKQNSGVCFDSSTGFTLPDDSVRSPDASWMSNKKYAHISDDEKQKFAHVCPDFVFELKSPSDNLKYLTDKMRKWIENGCALGWLVNPYNKTVVIFRQNGTVDKVTGFNNILSGEDVLPGFKLDLSILL